MALLAQPILLQLGPELISGIFEQTSVFTEITSFSSVPININQHN